MNTVFIKPFRITSQRVYAFSVLALLAFYLLGTLCPLRFADLNDTYGLVFTCLLFGVYLSRFATNSPVENKVYLFWIAWMLITRWLNGDIYLFVDFDLMITCILGFLFISAGTVLGKKDRDLFLDVLSLLYAGYFVVVAILGIFVFITNTYIHIPPENVWFTIRYDGAIFAPNFLSVMRLASAFRMMIAFCLLPYQLIKQKNMSLRILIMFSMLILFTATSLCHSRTTLVALMVSFVLIALLISQNLFRNKKRVISVLGSGVLAFAFAFGGYLGNDMVCKLVSNAHNTIAPAFEEYYNGLENKISEEYFGIGKSGNELVKYNKEQSELAEKLSGLSANTSTYHDKKVDATAYPLVQKTTPTQMKELSTEKAITANDHRSLLGNPTLSNRTWIWESCIKSIFRDPLIALKGLLSKQVVPTFNSVKLELYPYSAYSPGTHNTFMQVLMVSGIPGIILIVLWTVLVVIKMVKLFYCKSENVNLEVKLLTLPIASLFVLCLTESLLFVNFDVSGIVFSLCVGAFLGCYYDQYPSRAKN